MKRKLIFCTFALTVLLLGGCAQKYDQEAENHSTTGSTTTTDSAINSTDTAQSTSQPQSDTVPNNGNGTTMISEEEAKEIALIHAGLTADQVTFIKSALDRDDTRQHYDVEFYTNDNMEYDYEIDPYTGDILEADSDVEHYTQSTETLEGESITEDEAKQIALAEVPGATVQDIKEFKSDYDNGRLHYDGKIHYDEKEYEFEIDGYSGDFLEWDVEPITLNSNTP